MFCQKSIVLLILCILCCLGAIHDEISLHAREDPNTKQAFVQVRDIGISCLAVITVDDSKTCYDSRNTVLMTSWVFDVMSSIACRNILASFRSMTHKHIVNIKSQAPCYWSLISGSLSNIVVIKPVDITDLTVDLKVSLALTLEQLPNSIDIISKLSIIAVPNLMQSGITNFSATSIAKLASYLGRADSILLCSIDEYVNYHLIQTTYWNQSSRNNVTSLPQVTLLTQQLGLLSSDIFLRHGTKSSQARALKNSINLAVYIGNIYNEHNSSTSEYSLAVICEQFNLMLNHHLMPMIINASTSAHVMLHVIGDAPHPLISHMTQIEHLLADHTECRPKDRTLRIDFTDINDRNALTEVLQASQLLWSAWSVQYEFRDSLKHAQRHHIHELFPKFAPRLKTLQLVRACMFVGCVPILVPVSWSGAERAVVDPWTKSYLTSRQSGVDNGNNGYILADMKQLHGHSAVILAQGSKKHANLIDIIHHNYQAAAAIARSNEDIINQLDDVIVGGLMNKVVTTFMTDHLPHLRQQQISTSPVNDSLVHYRHHGGGSRVSIRAVAVLIEARSAGALEYCVRNVMAALGPSWGLVIYHSTGALGNEHFIRSVLHDLTNVTYKHLPTDFSDSNDYNNWLKSVELWGYLASIADRVLLFQTDSLMLSRNIEPFLMYDYIGAPWHVTDRALSSQWLRKMQRFGFLKKGIGNGGFSLRNPHLMLQIASKHGRRSGTQNEDVFFCCQLERLGAVLPNRSVAYSFAREVPCADLEAVPAAAGNDSSNNSMKPLPMLPPLALHSYWSYHSVEDSLKMLALIAHGHNHSSNNNTSNSNTDNNIMPAHLQDKT